MIVLNKPRFSLLCDNEVVRKFTADISIGLYNNLEHLRLTR